MTRRVRHLGTIRHMAELRSPTLASLATSRACEHAIARSKWNPFYRCTFTGRQDGYVSRPKHIFCDPISAGASPPLLACCGGHELSGRFHCEKGSRAVDRTLVASPSIPPTTVMVESRSLLRNGRGLVNVGHGRCPQKIPYQ